jgi:hypothetical protein
MAQLNAATYCGGFAVAPSDTALVSCRAIYVGGAGNLAVNTAPAGGTAIVFTAPAIGSIIPLELNEGRIMATGTTATLLVALQ